MPFLLPSARLGFWCLSRGSLNTTSAFFLNDCISWTLGVQRVPWEQCGEDKVSQACISLDFLSLSTTAVSHEKGFLLPKKKKMFGYYIRIAGKKFFGLYQIPLIFLAFSWTPRLRCSSRLGWKILAVKWAKITSCSFSDIQSLFSLYFNQESGDLVQIIFLPFLSQSTIDKYLLSTNIKVPFVKNRKTNTLLSTSCNICIAQMIEKLQKI